MTIAAQVLVADQIPADEAARVLAEFTSIGLTIDLRAVAPKRSLGEFAWLVLAALPLEHFFSRLAEDTADDVHERLRTFVNSVIRRQQAGDQPKPILVLQDTVSGVQVVLEPDLPAESYRQLLSFDLTAVRHGPLHYDIHSQRWRSELDEEAATSPLPDHPDR